MKHGFKQGCYTAMRRIAVLLAVMVASSVEYTDAASVKINCCELWDTVAKFIAVSTGEELSHKCPHPCMTHPAINRIVNIMMPALTHGEDPEAFEVESDEILVPGKISEVLVWSILGRLCSIEKYGSNHADFLQFNTASQTISVRRTGCEYQKTIYSTLLGFCAVVLTFIILTGVSTEYPKKPQQPEAPSTESTPPVNQPQHQPDPPSNGTASGMMTFTLGTPSKGRYRILG